MEPGTKDSGNKERQMVKGRLCMLMEIYTEGHGRMTSAMASVSIATQKVPFTKENGWTIPNREKAKKPGQLVTNILANTRMVSNMDTARSSGLTDHPIKVTGLKTTSLVLGSTSGLIIGNILAIGVITTCVVWAYTYTLTGLFMKATSKMIRKTVTEFINGSMAADLKVSGTTESNMALDSTKTQSKARSNSVFGNMESGLNGTQTT